MARTKRRIECVAWRDSWNESAGWHTLDDLRKDADALPLQTTVGFVVTETSRTLVVASSLSQGRTLAAAVVAIPKSAIRKRRRLR